MSWICSKNCEKENCKDDNIESKKIVNSDDEQDEIDGYDPMIDF